MTSDRFKEKEDNKPDKLVEQTQSNSQEKLKEVVPNHTDRIGTVVGQHYEILELIGVGGMSAVYKARHMLLDKTVTVKIILPKLISDQNTIERFKQEAKAATSLNHPNICNVSEYGLDKNGIPFISMDFIDGSSLEDLIEAGGTISLEQALMLIIEIGKGLSHAHENGIIHRDIKPANILVSKNSKGVVGVKIVDFGIAKIIREDESGPNLTKTGEIFGTPNYMSPEQCLGKSVDTRSDIYSLGCILFHILTGSAPFASESTLTTLMSHLNDAINPIPDVPSQVNQFIQRCMAKDPSDRYSNLEELLGDITKIQEGQNIESSNITNSSYRSSKTLLYSLTTIILALFIGIQLTRPKTETSNLTQKTPTTKSIQNTKLEDKRVNQIFKDIGVDVTPSDEVSKNIQPGTKEEKVRRTKIEWKQLQSKGNHALKNGDDEKAYDLYKQAVQTALDERASKKDLRLLYEELGDCALSLDKKDEATNAFYKAAAYSQYLGEKENLIKNLKELANTEMAMNKFGNAISHFEKIIKTKGNARDNSVELMEDWLALGEAYNEAGQYKNAKRSLEHVFRISKLHPGKNLRAVAFSHWVTARAERELGNLSQFKRHIGLSLKNGRQAKLPPEIMKKIETE